MYNSLLDSTFRVHGHECAAADCSCFGVSTKLNKLKVVLLVQKPDCCFQNRPVTQRLPNPLFLQTCARRITCITVYRF